MNNFFLDILNFVYNLNVTVFFRVLQKLGRKLEMFPKLFPLVGNIKEKLMMILIT